MPSDPALGVKYLKGSLRSTLPAGERSEDTGSILKAEPGRVL